MTTTRATSQPIKLTVKVPAEKPVKKAVAKKRSAPKRNSGAKKITFDKKVIVAPRTPDNEIHSDTPISFSEIAKQQAGIQNALYQDHLESEAAESRNRTEAYKAHLLRAEGVAKEQIYSVRKLVVASSILLVVFTFLFAGTPDLWDLVIVEASNYLAGAK